MNAYMCARLRSLFHFSVQDDLDDKLTMYKKKYEDAEAQLKEELRVVDRLTREMSSKVEQIHSMEMALTTEKEQHKAEVAILNDEMTTQQEDAEHTIMIMKNRTQELERSVEAFQVLEQENKNLRERVEELLGQLSGEDRGHAEETHRMKKEMFNLRMQLEQTFRKTLQELDAQSQKKAFDAMDDESKSALMANAKLKEELSLQSVGVENLLQRYQQIDDGFKTMKVDKGILEKNNDIQLQQIAGLKRHQYEYESRLSDMRQSMRTLNMERLQSEKQIQSMGDMLEELKKYKALYTKSQAR
jgi:chromosome segregation ATPase